MKDEFEIGDNLEAIEFDKKEYGIEFVTITSINHKSKIYHWKSPGPCGLGTIHSGYHFSDAKLYKK